MVDQQPPKTLGQGIDAILNGLKGLDKKDQEVAIKAACVHLGILEELFGARGKLSSPPQQPPTTGGNSHVGGYASKDIRTLKDEKQPSSAREMACLVAYYLSEIAPDSEKKEAISTPDLDRYFKQANFKLPKAIDQVLKDSKAAGYFDSHSHGYYKLNPVGYNLVVHSLPRKVRSGGVGSVESKRIKRIGRNKKLPRKSSRKRKKK